MSSFNAAPARSPGRTALPTRLSSAGGGASMRPRLARRGELSVRCELDTDGDASMRPRLARRGELVSLLLSSLTVKSLQCGPGSLAGENSASVCLESSSGRSFNAAPARSPGRTNISSLFLEAATKLQCGPGSLAGENRHAFVQPVERLAASMRPRLARRGEHRTPLFSGKPE